MQENKLKKPRRLDPAFSARVIDELGGTSAVARICGVTPSSASEWKVDGISRGYFMYLRERFSHLPIMREKTARDS